MKHYVLLGLLGLSVCSLPAFAADTVQNASNTTEQKNVSEDQKKFGEIIEVLLVINTNEVNVAKVALEKSGNAKVKQFAKQMEMEHLKNMQLTKAIANKLKIEPVKSEKSNSLQEEGKKEVENLNSLQANEFDKAYVDAMVKGHNAVLDRVKDAVSQTDSMPKLQAFLKVTQVKVEHHLQMAKNLQEQLNNSKSS